MANSEITNITIPNSSGTNVTYDIRDAQYSTYLTTSVASSTYQPKGSYVPTSRTINGTALTGNISLTLSQIYSGNYTTSVTSGLSALVTSGGVYTYVNDYTKKNYVPIIYSKTTLDSDNVPVSIIEGDINNAGSTITLTASYDSFTSGVRNNDGGTSSIKISGGTGNDDNVIELISDCDSDRCGGILRVKEYGTEFGYWEQDREQTTFAVNTDNAVTRNLLPQSADTYGIGTSANSYYTGYIKHIYTDELVYLSSSQGYIKSSSAIVPSSTNTYSLGAYNYKWTYLYSTYIGSSSYPSTAIYGTSIYATSTLYATTLRFHSSSSSSNYTTGIWVGRQSITMSATLGGETSTTFTIPKYVGSASGTWKYFVSVVGTYGDNISVGIHGIAGSSADTAVTTYSSTHSVTVWVRNVYGTTQSRTMYVQLLAVKGN